MKFIAAHHPKANGLAEGTVKVIKNMLHAYVYKQPNWHELLPMITLAYNTSFNKIINNTPFFLLYGREPSMPLETLFPQFKMDAVELQNVDPEEYADYLVSTLHSAWDTAKASIEKNKRSQKLQHDEAIKSNTKHDYEIGDLVLLKDMKRVKWKQPNVFRGPFRILDISGDTFKLDTSGTRLLPVVPLHRLKRYTKRKATDMMEDIGDDQNVPLHASPNAADAPMQEDDNEKYWAIKRILGMKRIRGTKHYLCDWEGEFEPSYQPASNLSPDLLADAKRKFG